MLNAKKYAAKNGLKANILVKIEAFNPAGSVKDRIALAMIEGAENKNIVVILPDSGDRYLSTALFNSEI